MESIKLRDLVSLSAGVGLGLVVAQSHLKLWTSKKKIGSSHPFSSKHMYRDVRYFDYNATTPIWPEVTEAMAPYSCTSFGNPSSSHVFGAPCKAALEIARGEVALLISASKSSEIIFTSCGSESDNRAIDIALLNYNERVGKSAPVGILASLETPSKNFNKSSHNVAHVVTSAIEHDAVLVYLRHLEKVGVIHLTVVGVDAEGRVSPAMVEAALRPSTALVTIMHSNNETGTIQPIKQIVKVVRNYSKINHVDIKVHSDAAQSLGKVDVNVGDLDVDLLTIVGHKFGAPKGIAALYVKETCSVKYPFLFGGGQESGRRAGTENVMLAVGLGEAARICRREATELTMHMLKLKQRLIKGLNNSFKSSEKGFLKFNGPYNELIADGDVSTLSKSKNILQLPNTVSVSFRGLKAYEIMPRIASHIACSAGSACHADAAAGGSISPVLKAMKVPAEYAGGTLRLSLGRHTTEEDVDVAIKVIASGIKQALEDALAIRNGTSTNSLIRETEVEMDVPLIPYTPPVLKEVEEKSTSNNKSKVAKNRAMIHEMISPTGELVKTKMQVDTLIHELESDYGLDLEDVLVELSRRTTEIDKSSFAGDCSAQVQARLSILIDYKNELNARKENAKQQRLTSNDFDAEISGVNASARKKSWFG